MADWRKNKTKTNKQNPQIWSATHVCSASAHICPQDVASLPELILKSPMELWTWAAPTLAVYLYTIPAKGLEQNISP